MQFKQAHNNIDMSEFIVSGTCICTHCHYNRVPVAEVVPPVTVVFIFVGSSVEVLLSTEDP